MAISFIRVDDRIIHGQVVTRWMSERPCDGVIAVDDKAANNPILSQALKAAVPEPLKRFVMTVDRTALKWGKIVDSSKNYFLIAKTPVSLQRLFEKHANFIQECDQLNVGPMSARENATKVGPNVAVTKDEAAAFDFLAEKGMTIQFKLVPDSKSYSWEEARQKL